MFYTSKILTQYHMFKDFVRNFSQKFYHKVLIKILSITSSFNTNTVYQTFLSFNSFFIIIKANVLFVTIRLSLDASIINQYFFFIGASHNLIVDITL